MYGGAEAAAAARVVNFVCREGHSLGRTDASISEVIHAVLG